YEDVAGWGFASTGVGFLAIAWVFDALKGRV
ncbi:MAG: CAL67264 family membrane protein, partial [Capnocytophaga granulosa]